MQALYKEVSGLWMNRFNGRHPSGPEPLQNPEMGPNRQRIFISIFGYGIENLNNDLR
jgi:hypothetical protein